ncbi:MAG: hypothetical protein HFJ27_05475 [Clostridia bacterium]|nr:hypothetical protein [Clostridia bacterium]
MIEFLIQLNEVISPIFYKIVYMSMIGSIIAILILLIMRFFDNELSAKWKCFIYLIPLLFLMLPINRIQISTSNDFAIASVIDQVETSVHTLSNYQPEKMEKVKQQKEQQEIEDKEELTKSNTRTSHTIDNYTVNMIIPIVWFLGTSIMILILIIENIRLIYQVTKAKKVTNMEIKLILMKCKQSLKIMKKIEIRIQNCNISPCIYGIIRPKILVSEQFCKQDSKVIENVFMHELSHYKRKDMITNYILLIMTAVHWFNPFAFRLFKKIRQEMELATDEIALSKMDKEQKKEYGLTLISLLQTYETRKVATKMLCITDDSKNMKRRIEKIKLSTKLKKYKKSIIILTTGIVICMVSPFILKPTNAASSVNEEKMYEKVMQYLIKEEQAKHKEENKEFTTNNNDFKTFIDMKKLGIRQNGDEVYVYVIAFIKNYQQEEIVGNGGMIPYKFIIKQEEIIDYQIPEDGEKYAKSLNEIFPEDIRGEINKSKKELEEERLDKQAEQYYNEINSANKENLFKGAWKPYKAIQHGNEIPLSQLYGSGIQYGGELIFNEDRTYTEFIGVYSEETIDDRRGTYKVSTDGKKAILTTNNKETKELELLQYIEDRSTNVNQEIIQMLLEDGTQIYFRK